MAGQGGFRSVASNAFCDTLRIFGTSERSQSSEKAGNLFNSTKGAQFGNCGLGKLESLHLGGGASTSSLLGLSAALL